MTTEHALRIFESGFSHPDFALTQEGNKAYEIACQAMREKIERENLDKLSNILLESELQNMDGVPVKVKIMNKFSDGLPDYISVGVLTMNDPNDSDNGAYVYGSFYSITRYGKTWVAYRYTL